MQTQARLISELKQEGKQDAKWIDADLVKRLYAGNEPLSSNEKNRLQLSQIELIVKVSTSQSYRLIESALAYLLDHVLRKANQGKGYEVLHRPLMVAVHHPSATALRIIINQFNQAERQDDLKILLNQAMVYDSLFLTTLLDEAVSHSRVEHVQLLLKAGADPLLRVRSQLADVLLSNACIFNTAIDLCFSIKSKNQHDYEKIVILMAKQIEKTHGVTVLFQQIEQLSIKKADKNKLTALILSELGNNPDDEVKHESKEVAVLLMDSPKPVAKKVPKKPGVWSLSQFEDRIYYNNIKPEDVKRLTLAIANDQTVDSQLAVLARTSVDNISTMTFLVSAFINMIQREAKEDCYFGDEKLQRRLFAQVLKGYLLQTNNDQTSEYYGFNVLHQAACCSNHFLEILFSQLKENYEDLIKELINLPVLFGQRKGFRLYELSVVNGCLGNVKLIKSLAGGVITQRDDERALNLVVAELEGSLQTNDDQKLIDNYAKTFYFINGTPASGMTSPDKLVKTYRGAGSKRSQEDAGLSNNTRPAKKNCTMLSRLSLHAHDDSLAATEESQWLGLTNS